MIKRATMLAVVAAILGSAAVATAQWDPNTDPSLVGWWKFDEGSGTVASDSSASANNGTLNGGAQWVAGRLGDALQFNGSDAYVRASHIPLDNRSFTITMWINPVLSGSAVVFSTGLTGADNTDMHFRLGGPSSGDAPVRGIRMGFYNNDLDSPGGLIADNKWSHITFWYDYEHKNRRIYVNGVVKAEAAANPYLGTTGDTIIGYWPTGGQWFKGMIDDVRIFSRPLTTAEVKSLVPPMVKATNPSPANGNIGVMMPLLTWTPGETALFEDVYLGDSPDLTAANRVSTHQSILLKMYFHVAPPLVPGQKYYWRIDEVEASGTTHTGDVWSFTMAPTSAYSPNPRNGDKWIDPNADLSWQPGQNAVRHNLYFGTDRAKVEARDASVSKGAQATTTFEPGTLAKETTYYWAVDESGIANYPGEVWSFTTGGGPGGVKGEYFNNTARDFSGAPTLTRIDPDINFNWGNDGPGAPIGTDHFSVRWTADLEIAVADAYTFTTNTDDGSRVWLNDQPIIDRWVDQAPADAASNPIQLEPGIYSLTMEYYENDGGAVAYLYWQTPTVARQIIPSGPLQPPVHARAIYPKDADVNVPQDATLMWSIGDKTVTHDVYFGTDKAAVEAATPADTAVYKGNQGKDENTFAPGALAFNTTYYWRVDEVNDAAAGSPWKGAVWSFTTADFIIVDDFETYTNDSPYRLFQTWIDGWGFSPDEFFPDGNPGNGSSSSVGHDIWATGTPYTTISETSIVHPGGSRKSMPFDYNNINSPYYSQTDRTWASGQNWTLNSADTLSLWFHGFPPKFLDSGTKITLSGAGSDIYNGTDEFRFAYKKLTGDGSISVKIESVQTLEAWTKAGVMIRESLDPLAMQAHMITAAQQKLVEWMYRAISGDTVTVQPTTAAGSTPLPVWVRVTRAGNVFTGEYSTNGTAWTKVTLTDGTTSSTTLSMPTSVYIGMVVCSHVTGAAAVAEFSDVKVSGNVTGQWQTVDVGVAQPGNDPDQLYVILQDSAGKSFTVNHPDGVNAVLSNAWTEWKIPLSQFTSVNPAKIKKMSIGVGDPKSPKPDGHGLLYFDDIRVIKPTP